MVGNGSRGIEDGLGGGAEVSQTPHCAEVGAASLARLEQVVGFVLLQQQGPPAMV